MRVRACVNYALIILEANVIIGRKFIVSGALLFLSIVSIGLIPLMRQIPRLQFVLNLYFYVMAPAIAALSLVYVIELLRAISLARRGIQVFLLFVITVASLILATILMKVVSVL